MPHTVLVLTPHPDDAEFFAGGTISQMAAAGDRILIAIATDGRCGSFAYDSDTLAAIRAEEARRGAALLGAEPPTLLGHPDMGLDRLPTGYLREQFIRLIRRHRPGVVICQDPFTPGETHPDHRATAWAATEAINASHLPLVHPEHAAEGLAPHFVVEKYFYREAAEGANRIVDISATFDRKMAALAAHESQVAFLVEEVMRQAALAGVDIASMLGDAASTPLAALRWAMQAQAAGIGQAIGAPGVTTLGEAFRYTRFDPILEAILERKAS